MTKYMIESIYNDRLKNNLTFGPDKDNIYTFDTIEDAEEKLILYGCTNCRVVPFEK